MTFKLTIKLVLATLAIALAQGQELKTDTNVYPAGNPPALPAAGGTFTDPVFGTTIMRITDESTNAAPGAVHDYSAIYTFFNRDSTRFTYLDLYGNRYLGEFDPVNFRLLKTYLIPWTLPTWYTSFFWSQTDPDVYYVIGGTALWKYNFRHPGYRMVVDFATKLPNVYWVTSRGISSDDTRFFIGTSAIDGSSPQALVYDQQKHKIVWHLDGATKGDLDKSGRWVSLPPYLYDLETGQAEYTSIGDPDQATSHHDWGTGIWAGDVPGFTAGFRLLQKATDFHVYTQLLPQRVWSQGSHFSLRSVDESWLTASYVWGCTLPHVDAPFADEIFQISLASRPSAPVVRRLAHHYSNTCLFSDPALFYWSEPRANVSMDGGFVTFTSNWGRPDRMDVFVIRMPPGYRETFKKAGRK